MSHLRKTINLRVMHLKEIHEEFPFSSEYGCSLYNMFFVILVFYFLTFSFSCLAAKDVVFVLDRSGSLDSKDVTAAIDFIHNVTEWLNIGTSDIQVSLVTFSDTVREEFNLGNFTNKTELLSTIDGLRSISSGGGTYTYDALDFVLTSSFNTTSGSRPGAEKAVVVITDGASNDLERTVNTADSLRTYFGAEVFSIGIGSSPDEDELNGISNDPNSYFSLSVQDFIYLCNLIPAIVPKLDSEANATLSESCPVFPTPTVSTTATPTETTDQTTTEQTTTTETPTTTTETSTFTTTEESTTTTAAMTTTTQLSTLASTTDQTTTSSTTTTEVPTTTTETSTFTTTEESTTTTAPTTTTTQSTTITTAAYTTTTTMEDTTETTNLKLGRVTENSTSNSGIIIGIVLGLLALLAFLLLLFCIRKKIKSHKPGPIDKKDCISTQYSEASLRPADMPRPLSYRRTTSESQNDTNGLLRESTTLSSFDVYV